MFSTAIYTLFDILEHVPLVLLVMHLEYMIAAGPYQLKYSINLFYNLLHCYATGFFFENLLQRYF